MSSMLWCRLVEWGKESVLDADVRIRVFCNPVDSVTAVGAGVLFLSKSERRCDKRKK